MIRSSACPLRQADPAQFGRHGDRISYTTSRDIISDCQAFSYNGGILTGILVPSGFSTATGVSDDGNVLSGYFIDSNSLFKAIRWTKQMGSSR